MPRIVRDVRGRRGEIESIEKEIRVRAMTVHIHRNSVLSLRLKTLLKRYKRQRRRREREREQSARRIKYNSILFLFLLLSPPILPVKVYESIHRSGRWAGVVGSAKEVSRHDGAVAFGYDGVHTPVQVIEELPAGERGAIWH